MSSNHDSFEYWQGDAGVEEKSFGRATVYGTDGQSIEITRSNDDTVIIIAYKENAPTVRVELTLQALQFHLAFLISGMNVIRDTVHRMRPRPQEGVAK